MYFLSYETVFANYIGIFDKRKEPSCVKKHYLCRLVCKLYNN